MLPHQWRKDGLEPLLEPALLYLGLLAECAEGAIRLRRDLRGSRRGKKERGQEEESICSHACAPVCEEVISSHSCAPVCAAGSRAARAWKRGRGRARRRGCRRCGSRRYASLILASRPESR